MTGQSLRPLYLGLGLVSAVTVGCIMRLYFYSALHKSRKRLKDMKAEVKSTFFVQSGRSMAGRIHIVNSSPAADGGQPDQFLRGQLMGLDCEWIEGGRVALLQLADAHGTCLLVRLCLLNAIPPSVLQILEDASIIKVGVGIQEDVSKLLRDFGVTTTSWVDIRHLAKRFRPQQRKLGLAGLTKEFLGVDLDKHWRVSASNWEAEELTERQVLYAANDAFSALGSVMVMAIESLETAAAAGPMSIAFGQQDSSRRADVTAVELCKPFAQVRFTNKSSSSSAPSGQSSTTKTTSTAGGANGVLSSGHKPPTKRQVHATRKTPLYNNAQLEAPDGQQLCVTDVGKAEWYVGKGLGRYISRDPVTVVRLNFEPAGRPEGQAGNYYLADKSNQCVVCGKKETYLRKYIVPHEYRKYFPGIMRDHQSHDILLFCIDCHQKGNLEDQRLRHKLADLCDAPIGTEEDVKVKEDFALKKVRSAGRALLNAAKSHSIPDKRRNELMSLLQTYYNVDHVTEEIMRKGANLVTNIPNDDYVPHGRKVVEHFMRGKGIIALEVMWRQHFLETMNPKFLHPNWSVDHQKQRLEIKAAENRIDPDDYALAIGSACSG